MRYYGFKSYSIINKENVSIDITALHCSGIVSGSIVNINKFYLNI